MKMTHGHLLKEPAKCLLGVSGVGDEGFNLYRAHLRAHMAAESHKAGINPPRGVERQDGTCSRCLHSDGAFQGDFNSESFYELKRRSALCT